MNGSDKTPVVKLCACRLAVAAGLLWGVGLLMMGIVTTYTDTYGQKFVDVFASIYWGYEASWGGAFLGLGWGFLDGFIGMLILIGLYNLFASRGSCCCGGSKKAEPPPSA